MAELVALKNRSCKEGAEILTISGNRLEEVFVLTTEEGEDERKRNLHVCSRIGRRILRLPKLTAHSRKRWENSGDYRRWIGRTPYSCIKDEEILGQTDGAHTEIELPFKLSFFACRVVWTINEDHSPYVAIPCRVAKNPYNQMQAQKSNLPRKASKHTSTTQMYVSYATGTMLSG